MASTFVSGTSSLGLPDIVIVFSGKTRYSRSASLHPGVKMGAGDLSARGSPVLGLHHISSMGGVEILQVALCYRDRDKFRPGGPLGPYADFFTSH